MDFSEKVKKRVPLPGMEPLLLSVHTIGSNHTLHPLPLELTGILQYSTNTQTIRKAVFVVSCTIKYCISQLIRTAPSPQTQQIVTSL
jgi:hypothetical protein